MGAENFKVKEVARVSVVLLNLASELGLITTTSQHPALSSLDQGHRICSFISPR